MLYTALLFRRGILRLTGPDRESFLQGLVSNDVTKLRSQQAIYSALLTPQGKFLHDLFIVENEGSYLIDGEFDRLDDLKKRLSLYKLRSNISFEDVRSDYQVFAVWGDKVQESLGLPETLGGTRSLDQAVVLNDPRLLALGARVIIPEHSPNILSQIAFCETLPFEAYDAHRLSLGVPDGSRDMLVEKAIILECGLNELQAISWEKGCYMGQELTARTRYRGLIRKRLIPVVIEGPTPEFLCPIQQEGKEVGELRSTCQDRGLALLRLEALSREAPFLCGEAILRPFVPDWMELPSDE